MENGKLNNDGRGKAGQQNINKSIESRRDDSDIHLEYPEGAVKAAEGRKPGRAMTTGLPRKEAQDQHVCPDWRYFLQRIQGNMKNEYFYYSVFNIPETKMDKAASIDEKIIEKYSCNMSKDQRTRNKKKGNANFQYFRFQNCGVILATPGKVVDCEPLLNVNIKPIKLRIETLEVVFRRSKVKIKDKKGSVIKTKTKYTLFLSDKCFEDKKEEFNKSAKHRNCDGIIEVFNRLNGIPAYGGIVQDKVKLKKHIEHLKRIHKLVDLDLSKLRINTYRKMYSNKSDQN